MTRIDADRRLYEELVRAFGEDVYRFVYRLCYDRTATDDLVQETFCEAWRSIRSLRDPAKGKAWLLGIARNRYRHQIRDGSRRIRAEHNVDQLQNVSSGGNADATSRFADHELLEVALSSLDASYAEPFLLVFQQGFTCKEAAELLKVPLGTVLSRIHRARKFLRRRIHELDPQERSPAAASARRIGENGDA